MTNRQKFLGFLAVIAVAGVAVAVVRLRGDAGGNGEANRDLSPERRITHGHGLAVDVADPNRLYIATHEGLLVLVNERDLYRIGRSRDDYMGFSVHPTDQKVFFSSGHPRRGGNIGVQRSDDGGVTWQRIAAGVRGPVDFHAMAVSPVNPDLLYGWYGGALQRSTDGGKTWELVPTSLSNVIRLVADPVRADAVYAATTDGLLVSADRGATWAPMSEALRGGAVTALAVFPDRPQELLAFSDRIGLARSTDGGVTWGAILAQFDGEKILFLAIAKVRPDTVYALTEGHRVLRSTDRGEQWERLQIGS